MSISMRTVKMDITKLAVDAIVNAANPTLLGGGGVDAAIHKAAGPQLLAECKTLGGCEPGDAKLTQAYRLSAKHVIHAVGPRWFGGNDGEAQLLASCYLKALTLAQENGCTSIAFPCISTGVYKFPCEPAAAIAVQTCKEFSESSGSLSEVIFCCFYDVDIRAYEKALSK